MDLEYSRVYDFLARGFCLDLPAWIFLRIRVARGDKQVYHLVCKFHQDWDGLLILSIANQAHDLQGKQDLIDVEGWICH